MEDGPVRKIATEAADELSQLASTTTVLHRTLSRTEAQSCRGASRTTAADVLFHLLVP